MCLLIVQAIDNIGVWREKTGDVLAIFEDGHKFGKSELGDPMFKIISMPGVPRAEVAHLLDTDTRLNSDARPIRKNRLALAEVVADVKAVDTIDEKNGAVTVIGKADLEKHESIVAFDDPLVLEEKV